jgi:hypothetical protein
MSAARALLGPILRAKSSLRMELGATVNRIILTELPYTPGTTPGAADCMIIFDLSDVNK